MRDGADDQDHDDVPNVMELSRTPPPGWTTRAGRLCTPREDPPLPRRLLAPERYGRVNPFNPCLPNTQSRTCPQIVEPDSGAPFDGSPNWYSLN